MTSTSLILNVDDNEGARYAKTRILQSAGYKVAEVANGTDALAFVREEKPDLVLLDVKLPDINGIEVCRQIKEEPSSAAILVIQTSAALTKREDRIRGLEGGADNYLVAPIEADELVANVNAMLRLRSAQAELRDSEERFRELAENIEDVFWVISDTHQILYVSPAYEKMWKRSIRDLLETPDDWLNAVDEGDRAHIGDRFSHILQGRDYDEEYRISHPDGTTRWVRDRAYAVKNSHHQNYRIVRITNDISARKNSEHLLQEADKNKNTFLAMLAHELRNPLAPIRNAVSVMQEAGAESPQIQEKARDIIIRQTDHLAHLVDDLLDVARISQGKIALKKARTELRQVIQLAVDAAMPLLEARGHSLNFQAPDADILLEVDPVRLSQCIGNLLHNAAKFTPMGGQIQLKIELDKKLKITVEDNGIGISSEKLPHIFDLFSQGEISPDHVQDGLGIGLSLTKRLIELHNGQITARSDGTGSGSSFTIDLPIIELSSSTAKNAAEETSIKTSGENLRILVVDDNEDSREMMALLLSMKGHATLQAKDALSAIDIARENALDAIISDIGLPGLDGYHIARTLRNERGLEGLRLIALTGYGAAGDQKEARDAGFDHHFVKPVDMDDLMSVIHRS
jgi:PAS domain S-box-containing protein